MKHFYYLSSGKLILIIFSLLSIGASNYCRCRPLFSGPKTVQASVTLLEQLPVFMEKCGSEILQNDILPMVYLAMESSMSQVRMAAVSVVPNILDSLGDIVIRVFERKMFKEFFRRFLDCKRLLWFYKKKILSFPTYQITARN